MLIYKNFLKKIEEQIIASDSVASFCGKSTSIKSRAYVILIRH